MISLGAMDLLFKACCVSCRSLKLLFKNSCEWVFAFSVIGKILVITSIEIGGFHNGRHAVQQAVFAEMLVISKFIFQKFQRLETDAMFQYICQDS